MIKDTQKLIKKYQDEGIAIPKAPVAVEAQEVKGDAKQQAEQQLREQLAQLKVKEESAETDKNPSDDGAEA